MEPNYVDLKWVALRFRYSPKAVQDMARRGKLPGARKCGSRWRVRREEIEKAWG